MGYKITKRKLTKHKRKPKTKTLKAGTIVNYNILSNEGFKGSIIIPNIPFIDESGLITKLGIETEITKEYNAYKKIKELNNNQDEYEMMQIKVLCDPQPIMHKINFDLFKLINNNDDLFIITPEKQNNRTSIKPEYTHGLTIKRGDYSLMRMMYNLNGDLLFRILYDIKPIMLSLNELNKKGFIHGDIKLNNILVYKDKYYLIDLGTFIGKEKFKSDAIENKNELSTYLEHIPFECQYINNSLYTINDKLLIDTKTNYKLFLQPFYIKIQTGYNENDFTRKYDNDINDTFLFSMNNKREFIEKLFNTYDVFSIGFVIINILHYYQKYITLDNVHIIVNLYNLLINEVFTYNLNQRITMQEFINKYNAILI